MSLYPLLAALGWITFLAVWVIYGLKDHRASSRIVSRAGTPIRLLTFVAAATLIFSEQHGIGSSALRAKPPQLLAPIGVLAVFAGIGFAVWARVVIGSQWGMPMTVRERPRLVTAGPYQLVRHPIYTGVILGMVGSAMVSGWVWLIIGAIFGFYFIYSARSEEQTMSEKFPGEYASYQARTKMLIPYIF